MKPFAKLLIEVGRVPDGGRVAKRTGATTYTVMREIRVFGDPNIGEIRASPGTVFLANTEKPMVAQSIPSTTEVFWEVTRYDLSRLLDRAEEDK